MTSKFLCLWFNYHMTPKEQNMLKSLNLLTTLSHSRQQFSNGLSDEEKYTITISRQLLTDSGLTIFELINSVRKLSEKGYTQHYIIYDEHLRSQINEALKKTELEDELKKLEVLDTEEMSDKIKAESIASLNKLAPTGKGLDSDDLKDDFIKISEASRESIKLYKKLRPDEVALIFMLPFRSLNRLLKKMEDGIKFDQVQDTNIWYEPSQLRLHVGESIFTTANRRNPTKVHFIMDRLFNNDEDKLIADYSSVEGFDDMDGIEKESKKYYLSMHNFLKKNGKLREIFENHSDRLTINEEYIDDIN
jgi:hypothetical protein